MSNGTRYTIPAFIREAKDILAGDLPLEGKKAAIGDRLSLLSRRDDLTRLAIPVGPADASTGNFLLWREPPYISLFLAQFDPGYLSPVHEHGDFWVVSCGYRGRSRWDIYERLDDGSRPGYAEVKLVDQVPLPPGVPVWMPPPPRAIHAHNNEFDGDTLEILFSAIRPIEPPERVIYDVEGRTCFPSPWRPGAILIGDTYPPRPPSPGGPRRCTVDTCIRPSGTSSSSAAR